MTKKKTLQSLLEKNNPQFITDGKVIIALLSKKYGTRSTEGLDNIINTLCCSLVHLISHHVVKDDYPIAIQLVHQILYKNLLNKKNDN